MPGPFLRAVAALAVAACLPAAAAPQAPTAAQLMAFAFPGWGNGARLQSVTLPGPAARGAYAGWQAGANRALAEPRLVVRTDAAHLTLIASLIPAAADGIRPVTSHLTPVALAAYQFERRGDAWALGARQGVFALRGFFGEAKVAAVALSRRHQALAVEYGSCWQGYCGTWMTLYEVEKDKVRREPLVELALSGININSTLDCARRLQPLIKPPPQDTALHEGGDGAAPGSHDCYAIESSWSIGHGHGQPGDLDIHYRGAISRADAHAGPPAAIDQRQVLRYESGRYRAVSGFNPVPPL